MVCKACKWAPSRLNQALWSSFVSNAGKFNQHIDLWDALEPENQEFLSREGVSHVLSQLTSLSRAPDLDTPHFTILKKKKKYEIRR